MRHPATSNGYVGAFDFVRRVRISFFNTQMGKRGCRGTSVRLSDFELPIYDADLDRHLQPHTMRPETESLEGLGGQSREGHAV